MAAAAHSSMSGQNEWGASQFQQHDNWHGMRPMDWVGMRLPGFYWSISGTSPLFTQPITEGYRWLSRCFANHRPGFPSGRMFCVEGWGVGGHSAPLWFTLSACVWGDGLLEEGVAGRQCIANALFRDRNAAVRRTTDGSRTDPRWRLLWHTSTQRLRHSRATARKPGYQMLAS